MLIKYSLNRYSGFRPLARKIGSYTGSMQTGWVKYYEFPAPREVDRFLYRVVHVGTNVAKKNMFPAPLEVDRFLYIALAFSCILNAFEFPAPLEVDR